MIKVNQTEITEHQVNTEMQYHSAENQRDAMIKASEALVIAELLRQKAVELKIDIDDQDRFVDTLLDQQVDYPEASEEDCKQYYDHNLAKFKTSPLLAVKHILFACSPEDQEKRSELVEKANLIIDELIASPNNFDALAQEFSSCPSAKVGGQLGQISRGQTVPEFERQLFNCSVGLVDAPLESRYGIHVVQIDHREEGRQLPFEKVKDNIRDYLNERVRHKAISQYISTLIDSAEIEGFAFDQQDKTLFH